VDYFWHLVVALTELALAAFATSTLLETGKNSFSEGEIWRNNSVAAAKAKSRVRIVPGFCMAMYSARGARC